MSFIYSRALVEASSLGKCLDTDASAQSSGSPTPLLYLPSDKTTAFSRLSRFGMTFAPLTDTLGAELLTSWLAASRARTSASQERAPASPESVPACGPTWRASLAKFDPVTSSWKTVQLSLLGDSELSSVTWPRSGMTVDGQCLELVMSAPRTAANESGWWPTPQRSDYKGTSSGSKFDSRARQFRIWSKGQNVTGAIYPNPTAYEGLMGWPLGWTDLKPSATVKFHSAPQPHGKCLEVAE